MCAARSNYRGPQIRSVRVAGDYGFCAFDRGKRFRLFPDRFPLRLSLLPSRLLFLCRRSVRVQFHEDLPKHQIGLGDHLPPLLPSSFSTTPFTLPILRVGWSLYALKWLQQQPRLGVFGKQRGMRDAGEPVVGSGSSIAIERPQPRMRWGVWHGGLPLSPILSPPLSPSCFHLAAELSRTLMKVGGRGSKGRRERGSIYSFSSRQPTNMLCGRAHSLKGFLPSSALSLPPRN